MTSLVRAAMLIVVCVFLVADTQDATQTAVAQPPATQGSGRGAIQTPTGGRGPGAAPDAGDPANADADFSPKPPVLPLSPAEQATRFWLPPGYRLEPVLADPIIDSPAQITFDGNGRMFVVELRGYEQTLDGIDAIAPVGRISTHEDRNNDGTFEHHTVFVDKLLFPRFAMPFGANAVLTMETNADEVWKYTDTNGDGVADKKELFTTNFGRGGHLESQQAGLFWALDNWMYSTVNAFRIRWTPTGVLREATGPNGAQWSVTQDDDGKAWFQHGASGMPAYFQFPVHYGNFAPPASEQFEPNLNITWGAPILIGDIQAGLPGTRMPDGSLIYATASAGNEIYRGDRLPKDLLGDYLYGETVARIVRRLRPVKTEGLTTLQNVYPRSEFIRSLDPLFRPVDIAAAPDGVLYIADMYRGIIEGAPWAMKGTYPAAEDRAVPTGQNPRPRPRMAPDLRRHRARSDKAADAPRDRGAAGRAPGTSQRLVARHGAAAARPQAGSFGRPGAAADGSRARSAAGPLPCALDARRVGRPRRRTDPRSAAGQGPKDAYPGDSRQRVALQGWRQVVCRRLARACPRHRH